MKADSELKGSTVASSCPVPTKSICGIRTTVIVTAVAILFLTVPLYAEVRRPSVRHISSESYVHVLVPALGINESSAAVAGGNGTALGALTARRHYVTITTAFINIGEFSKGSVSNVRRLSVYEGWMAAYAKVLNPVVGYFDDADVASYFAGVREGLPTKVVMVNRTSLWSFSLQQRIERVFADPGYPKNHPKTTSSAYVCAMHAKYDFLEATVKANHFGSTYFAWADLGLYREIADVGHSPPFYVRLPMCYEEGTVAFTQVYPITDQPVAAIMRNGLDWVGGGLFFSSAERMLTFCADYRRSTEALLLAGLANHDQSVILSMYSKHAVVAPAVALQAFVSGNSEDWFHLADMVRNEWLESGKPRPIPPTRCSYELYS